MSHKISIITISYNNKEGLEKTLKSVTSQDYKDFEYIVIDGCSNDGSKEILQKYSDQISYWVSEPDKGIYNALNKGIRAANGEYLFFLNAGDLFINNLSLGKAAAYVHTEDIIYFNIEVKGQGKDFVKECPEKLDIYFFYKDTLPHQGSFIKASSFDKVGLYDESMKIVADWKWYLIAICFSYQTYKKVDDKFSIFFLDGISSTNNKMVTEERSKVISELPDIIVNSAINIEEKIAKMNQFESKFNHLRNYRLVKLLNVLGLIKIPN